MRRVFIMLLLFFTTCTLCAQEIKGVKITDVEKRIAESEHPLVINMWATWCKPCLEELPYFLEEIKKINKKGIDTIDILLVSLDFKEDFPKKVTAFAKKRKFNVPIVWLDETNADYFCPKIDPQWSGGIPGTLFINNKTGYRKFLEEKISHEDLKKEIGALLDKNQK